VVFAVVVIVVVIGLVSLTGAFVPDFELFSEEQPTPPSFGYMLVAWLSSPVLPLLPIAIAFSIMRYRLWDIDRLISRALVYSALTIMVIVTYAAVVGGLGVLFQSRGNFFFSLVAAGLIAVALQPLRDRLQRAVNRLLYGERDDPYVVLSRLRWRLDLALAPNAVLPAIVETAGQTLKLPYAAIRLNNETMAAYGALPVNVRAESFPLAYQGETIGYLEVAPRAAGESFTPDERRLLADIAHQAGVVAHNIRLAADLQRAREWLVTAREEERRRLRRDLHDGLGPKLAGQVLILEAIRDSLETDSPNYALADHLIKDSQTIVAEVRRLVHGLRPPALDDFGLAGAVRVLAAQYESAKLRVSVTLPEPMPPLPAAVEVAAYRIAQESLTNVFKHAQATSCAVRMAIAEELSLEIVDNGVGLSPNRQAGVGLSSMRERAEEIGGSWRVENAENGGARVLAKLPLTRL
jgi:signal transduction histidine kinase